MSPGPAGAAGAAEYAGRDPRWARPVDFAHWCMRLMGHRAVGGGAGRIRRRSRLRDAQPRRAGNQGQAPWVLDSPRRARPSSCAISSSGSGPVPRFRPSCAARVAWAGLGTSRDTAKSPGPGRPRPGGDKPLVTRPRPGWVLVFGNLRLDRRRQLPQATIDGEAFDAWVSMSNGEADRRRSAVRPSHAGGAACPAPSVRPLLAASSTRAASRREQEPPARGGQRPARHIAPAARPVRPWSLRPRRPPRGPAGRPPGLGGGPLGIPGHRRTAVQVATLPRLCAQLFAVQFFAALALRRGGHGDETSTRPLRHILPRLSDGGGDPAVRRPSLWQYNRRRPATSSSVKGGVKAHGRARVLKQPVKVSPLMSSSGSGRPP